MAKPVAATAPPPAPRDAPAGDPLAEAHREILSDPTLQFRIEGFEPPPRTDWNGPLADFFEAIAPFLKWVFYGGLAVIAVFVLVMLAREIARRLPQHAAKADAAPDQPRPEFRPQQARARALLEEADRLAAEGRYSEAARVLLHRSIEDMERAFPASIAQSMTSREIAKLEPLSESGRTVFTRIAQAVERSLFGGRDLDAAAFAECRSAYASFAFDGGRA